MSSIIEKPPSLLEFLDIGSEQVTNYVKIENSFVRSSPNITEPIWGSLRKIIIPHGIFQERILPMAVKLNAKSQLYNTKSTIQILLKLRF